MLATVSQFGFLVLVACSNLCLGFALARYLGFGRQLDFEPHFHDASHPAGDAEETAADEPARDLHYTAAAVQPPGSTEGTSSEQLATDIISLLDQSCASLEAVVAPLIAARDAQTPATVIEAATIANDGIQELQQHLSASADRVRREVADTKCGEQAAAVLDDLWTCVDETRGKIAALDCDEDLLDEAIQRLHDSIQAISSACLESTQQLDDCLAAVQLDGDR